MNNECWYYAGSSNNEGYGLIFDGHKQYRAHRVMYENLIGKIPTGLILDHLCRVRICINPNHLEPVTNKENILRGISKQALNARKTHCLNGHIYDKANTILDRNGWRKCRICQRAYDLKSKHKARVKH